MSSLGVATPVVAAMGLGASATAGGLGISVAIVERAVKSVQTERIDTLLKERELMVNEAKVIIPELRKMLLVEENTKDTSLKNLIASAKDKFTKVMKNPSVEAVTEVAEVFENQIMVENASHIKDAYGAFKDGRAALAMLDKEVAVSAMNAAGSTVGAASSVVGFVPFIGLAWSTYSLGSSVKDMIEEKPAEAAERLRAIAREHFAGVKDPEREHSLRTHTFRSPAWCYTCKCLLYGVINQVSIKSLLLSYYLPLIPCRASSATSAD